jgi:hypothetical protein
LELIRLAAQPALKIIGWRLLPGTLRDELLHRSRGFFDRHVQIDTMLVEQIDRILEPLERRLRDPFDVLRATI